MSVKWNSKQVKRGVEEFILFVCFLKVILYSPIGSLLGQWPEKRWKITQGCEN